MHIGVMGGVEHWLFRVISGVLQGCPLSGSPFVIAIDPLLFMFERRISDPSYGMVAACADDIGAFLEELQHLSILFEIFDVFGKASGLLLKPRKCVIILLSVVASDANIAPVKLWMKRHIPQWAPFCIAARGTRLSSGPWR